MSQRDPPHAPYGGCVKPKRPFRWPFVLKRCPHLGPTDALQRQRERYTQWSTATHQRHMWWGPVPKPIEAAAALPLYKYIIMYMYIYASMYTSWWGHQPQKTLIWCTCIHRGPLINGSDVILNLLELWTNTKVNVIMCLTCMF